MTFTYDNAGNLTVAANSNGAYTMAYDAMNRMTLVNEPVGAILTMIYDALGNRTEVQDGTGKEDSTYDAENRLTRRVYYQGTSTEVIAVQEAYDALDELTTLNRYYGSRPEQSAGSTNYGYDDDLRLTNLQHVNGGGTSIANYTYTYDAASNVQTETRNGSTITYTYDAANELLGSSTDSFTYDATGNRTNTGYSTSAGNELTSDGVYSYTYDANGNEVTKYNSSTTWTYSYDNNNEMTSAVEKVSGTTVMSAVYKYDAFGNRTESDVTQSGSTTVTKFILEGWKNLNGDLMGNDNWDVLADISSTGTMKTRYVRGDAVDQIFAELAYNGSSFTPDWTLTDIRGSVRDIINNAGTVQDSISYSAFGKITSETNSANRGRYAWSGRELDVETGCSITGRAITIPIRGGGLARTRWALRRGTAIFTAMCIISRRTIVIQVGGRGYLAIRLVCQIVAFHIRLILMELD